MVVSYELTPIGLKNWQQHRKLPDDKVFSFNSGSAAEWYFTLRRMTRTGSLPRVSRKGRPLVYRVYRWGGKPVPHVNLFPGFDRKGRKRMLLKYGRLDKNKEYWLAHLKAEREEQS